ncbi:hypothetical protein HA402_000571 [Bradysia odoriphaga]|nr:hypothetical protein HA402_000571 [Bradysia odoriphaga]
MPKYVQVVYLPKSGGVVERTKQLRIESRDQRIREQHDEAGDHTTLHCSVASHTGCEFAEPESGTDDIIQTNVVGFICVTNVDTDRQTLTVLSPQPRPLPNTVLLVSEFFDRKRFVFYFLLDLLLLPPGLSPRLRLFSEFRGS